MEKHSLLDQWLAAEEAQTALRKRGPELASREQALSELIKSKTQAHHA